MQDNEQLPTTVFPLSAVAITKDPIEVHILVELEKLRHQNMRLKKHIEKSGMWAELKPLDEWKSYDFFYYFCTVYQKKYGIDYVIKGNVFCAFDRIQMFLSVNKIKNEKYKQFVDTAFARYFDADNKPVVGHLCSHTLYNKLMRGNTQQVTKRDFMDLDEVIGRESEALERRMSNDADFSFIDDCVQADNERLVERSKKKR